MDGKITNSFPGEDRENPQRFVCKDGIYYQLPLLTTSEYVLVRNLLSCCPADYWDKRHKADELLEKLKTATNKVFVRDGELKEEPSRRVCQPVPSIKQKKDFSVEMEAVK